MGLLALDRGSKTHVLSWLRVLSSCSLSHMTACLIVLQDSTLIRYIGNGKPVGSRELEIAGGQDATYLQYIFAAHENKNP